jgi:hypothetical protein
MATISTPTAAARAEPAYSATLVGIAAVVAVFGLMLFLPQVLNDGDTYWHLAAGEWILTHGRVPREDIFSFTWSGRPWVDHEWLAQLVMALAFRAGGWSGVLVLFALSLAGTMAILARRAGQFLSPLALTATLFLAFAVMAPSLLVRPHLLALPLLALWISELLAARDERRAPGLWLPLLMIAWVNMHGSFVLGFVLLAPLALEAVVEAGEGRWKAVRDWGLVGVLSLAAILVTPLGLDGVVQPLRILSMGTLNGIIEWQSADFSKITPFEAALLATLFVCLSYGVRMPALRAALLALVLHMALQHQRFQIVVAVVIPLLLAEPLAVAFGRERASPPKWNRAALAGVIVMALLAAARQALPVTRSDGETSPVSALAHVPPALRTRPVLNSYGFGGYLIFEGVRPFIDGRSEMYGDAFFARQQRMIAGEQTVLDKGLAEYGIAWTILAPGEPLVGAMDRKPGWRRLYADRYAVVHVRSAP